MIVRRRHTANYTTIGNALFEDDRLRADEVGILAYLLSRPDNWEVRRPALMRRWGMGREAIKRVIFNLVRTGWCQPEKTRLPNGTFYMIYEIRDQPADELSEDEARRALALVSADSSSECADEIAGEDAEVSLTDTPATGQPATGQPATGNPYVAVYKNLTNTDLPNTDSTKFERERERAKEKHAANLVKFKGRWPDVANDDQVRLDNAWFALTPEEGEAALAGIPAFIDSLKRGDRHTPASFTYLSQKRWELLQAAKPAAQVRAAHPPGSDAARAILQLHDIARLGDFARRVYRASDGGVTWRGELTPRLLAMANAPPAPQWIALDHQQAAAWDRFIGEHVTVATRPRIAEGAMAPWPWPPRKDGAVYSEDGSDGDVDAMTQEGMQR